MFLLYFCSDIVSVTSSSDSLWQLLIAQLDDLSYLHNIAVSVFVVVVEAQIQYKYNTNKVDEPGATVVQEMVLTIKMAPLRTFLMFTNIAHKYSE